MRMSTNKIKAHFLTLLFVALGFCITSIPLIVSAQVGQTGGKPNQVCIQWYKCVQDPKCKAPPVQKCTEQTPLGSSIGHCVTILCEGDTAPGQEGGQEGLDKGLMALQGLLDQVMKALMGGMGGGGGGSMPPPMPTQSTQPQEPNVLDQITPSTSDALRDALEGTVDEEGGVLDSIFGIFGGDDDEESGTTVTATSTGSLSDIVNGGTSEDSSGEESDSGSQDGNTGSAGSGTQVSGEDTATLSGERNEVRASDNEATLEAGVRDEEENSEVSGFYGFTTRAIGQVSVVERLCTSRPWANSFVSRIIPETFFDGLCVKRGFDVTSSEESSGEGVQEPANITEVENQVKARIEEREKPNVSAGEAGMLCEPESARPGADITLSFSCGDAELTGTAGFTVADATETSAVVNPIDTAQYAIACSDSRTYSCIVQVFDPRVAIWADPENVPLGTRTTIFWTTEDVGSCSVTGPSFSETGEFGGASTVPINGSSEYSITCVAPDGTEITETTTVDLSI